MISWITDSLGTCACSRFPSQTDAVCVDVRDIVDKAGNPPERIKERLHEIKQLISQSRPVIVCCDYGISRSNTLAAGGLALAEGISLTEALSRVVEATGNDKMQLSVVSQVQQVLQPDSVSQPPDGVALLGCDERFYKYFKEGLQPDSSLHWWGKDETGLTSGPLLLFSKLGGVNAKALVHAASQDNSGTTRSMGQAITMLRNSIEACVENGSKLFFLSNHVVFNGHDEGAEIGLDTPVCPKGIQAETSCLAEELIQLCSRQYGLDYCIIRLPGIYAHSSQPKFIDAFVGMARAGETLRVHKYDNGLPQVNLLHVRDACQALSRIVQVDLQGVVHVGAPQMTVKSIAEEVVHAVQSSSQVEEIRVEGSVSNLSVDTSDELVELGWAPKRSLSAWLEDYVQA